MAAGTSFVRLPSGVAARPDISTLPPNAGCWNTRISCAPPFNANRGTQIQRHRGTLKKWTIYSADRIIADISLSDEEKKSWEESRQALLEFDFSVEDKDKMLGKAFGHVHSPYWSEERKREVPKFETVTATLDYLRTLGLSDDDLKKLLKKFPEVLGCSLERELVPNVKTLENVWGIQGKSLRSLLLRNPKVLGFNVDCKGDCLAQCTRCWVRF